MDDYSKKLKAIEEIANFAQKLFSDLVEIEKSETKLIIKVKKDAFARRSSQSN